MTQSFQALTTFDVEDETRPWGKVRDILMEYPSCRNRYLGVGAHVGFGVKEIWAPIEMVQRTDAEGKKLTLHSSIDKDLVRHLERLEAPKSDKEELRLHNLYHSRPNWTQSHYDTNGKKKKFKLRNNSRMVRLSSLLHWDIMTRDGSKGKVSDLLVDLEDLQTLGFEFTNCAGGETCDFFINRNQAFLIDQGDHALYFDQE
jgi:hypothetical protein